MMKHMAALCGALAITGMTVAAQTTPQTPRTPQTPQTPQATQTAREPITVTGCVMKAASSTSTAAATRYVLTNVQHAADAAKPAGGATSPATGASIDPEQSFALDTEGSNVDLTGHLNHKVSLTGTLDTSTQRAPQASSTGTSGSTGTATPGRDAAAMQMPIATLKVTTLKMVSATCP